MNFFICLSPINVGKSLFFGSFVYIFAVEYDLPDLGGVAHSCVFVYFPSLPCLVTFTPHRLIEPLEMTSQIPMFVVVVSQDIFTGASYVANLLIQLTPSLSFLSTHEQSTSGGIVVIIFLFPDLVDFDDRFHRRVHT